MIAEADRKIFHTKGGRVVRDGGGIEPDLLLDPLQLSPPEAIFVSNALYSDFADKYLKSHSFRPAIKEAVDIERLQIEKDDPAYAKMLRESLLSQFLVVDLPDGVG